MCSSSPWRLEDAIGGADAATFGGGSPGALPDPGKRESVPALVVPEVAERKFPWGAPIEPSARAACESPADVLNC